MNSEKHYINLSNLWVDIFQRCYINTKKSADIKACFKDIASKLFARPSKFSLLVSTELGPIPPVTFLHIWRLKRRFISQFRI